jgi:hypothetical protein
VLVTEKSANNSYYFIERKGVNKRWAIGNYCKKQCPNSTATALAIDEIIKTINRKTIINFNNNFCFLL